MYDYICLECQISARLLAIQSVTNHDYSAAFGSGLILPLVSPALVFSPILFILFFSLFVHSLFLYINSTSYRGKQKQTNKSNFSLSDLPRLPVTRPCRGPPCPRSKFLFSFSLSIYIFSYMVPLLSFYSCLMII